MAMSDAPDPQATCVEDVVTATLGDEPTLELVLKAQHGDSSALAQLLERMMPQLRRWAHGKLPAVARGQMDTGDLVHEAVMNAIRHLDTFQPRGVGAMQAYLRQSVRNRIRDEVRRVTRRGVTQELPEDVASDERPFLDQVIADEAYDRYRTVLATLERRSRQLVIARIELEWNYATIAEYFGYRSGDGARMATNRAIDALKKQLA